MAANRPTLFERATIIAYDEHTNSLKTLRNASLLVRNGRISQLTDGTLSDVPANTEIMDATDKIISPGFIDTHHHMWQSAFRTLGANTTLAEYLAGLHAQTGPAATHFTPDDVYLGQMACALEMIDGGTTTVLDHAHAVFTNAHIDAAVEASFESGLRVFFAHTIQPIEATGYTVEMGIEKLFALSQDPRFLDSANPVELAVAYDGWAFASSDQNSQFMDTVIRHNNHAALDSCAPISAITTHMVAGPYGAENSPTHLDALKVSALGQSTLTTHDKIPLIFSHASSMSHKDAKLIRGHPHVSISTTPESEAHYGHTSIGAELCQDCASLGVDTHFTFSTYMPFQARMWLQSLRDRRYRQTLDQNWEVPMNNPMDCEAAFLLMTQKGGEALGRNDLGVIKIGAQADLVIFDTKSRAALWGVRDPVAAVVLHTGSGGDVEAVMVQGRWVKKEHKIQDLVGSNGPMTAESVRNRFQQSALRIQKIWEGLDPIVFEEGAANATGGRYGRTKTVQVTRKPH